jgi:hypothetical protein
MPGRREFVTYARTPYTAEAAMKSGIRNMDIPAWVKCVSPNTTPTVKIAIVRLWRSSIGFCMYPRKDVSSATPATTDDMISNAMTVEGGYADRSGRGDGTLIPRNRIYAIERNKIPPIPAIPDNRDHVHI